MPSCTVGVLGPDLEAARHDGHRSVRSGAESFAAGTARPAGSRSLTSTAPRCGRCGTGAATPASRAGVETMDFGTPAVRRRSDLDGNLVGAPSLSSPTRSWRKRARGGGQPSSGRISTVWSRPGPTPTAEIGAPVISSSARDVGLRVLRQVVERPGAGDVLGPAVEVLVDRRRRGGSRSASSASRRAACRRRRRRRRPGCAPSRSARRAW